jgi:hypothetical protein
MSVEFKHYERAESTLESQGTVLSLVGKDGKLGFIPKNLNDEDKRVVIILTKKNGTSTAITCSEAVSKGLRDKSIKLGNLINFEVLEGESGIPFISLPSGALAEVAVKNIVAVEYVANSVSALEALA